MRRFLRSMGMDKHQRALSNNSAKRAELSHHYGPDGLDPQLPGRALSRTQWDALWTDLVDLLHDGVRRGKIETLRPEHDPRVVDMGVGPCALAAYVYKRTGEPCLVCGTPVAHARHLARNLFWCPVCQAPEPVRPVRRAAHTAGSRST
jgi:endonuclease VIII